MTTIGTIVDARRHAPAQTCLRRHRRRSACTWSPTRSGSAPSGALPVAFPPDWQVTLDGDAGEFTETLESKYVRPRMASTPGVFGDYAVIAAGYNYPYWDPARFDRSIDSMVATMLEAGVKHVFWVTLREVKPQYVTPAAWRQIQPYYWYFPTVNDHLEQRAGTPPQPVADRLGGGRRPTRAHLRRDPSQPRRVGAVQRDHPRRDRTPPTTAQPAGTVARVAIPDAAGVAAVSLNLTTDDPRAGGFLTAYDCDQPRPEISNHNFARDATVAHAAIVPVSAAGEVCVYTNTSTNLIVDVTGRFGDDGCDRRQLDTARRHARARHQTSRSGPAPGRHRRRRSRGAQRHRRRRRRTGLGASGTV